MYYNKAERRIKRETRQIFERIVFLAEKKKTNQSILSWVENDPIIGNIIENRLSTTSFTCYSEEDNFKEALNKSLERIYNSYFLDGNFYKWTNGNSYLNELTELLKAKKTKKEVVDSLMSDFNDDDFIICYSF